jgi:hypothetical protein
MMPLPFDDPNKTFNARFVPPDKVAETFIPNHHYWKLCEPSHTLLVGTRGSGKTTLLKMLTYRALRRWQHERAQKTLRDLPFRAVYIPTDLQWERDLAALKARGCPTHVLEAAVTANAFRAFTEALQDTLEEEPAGLPSPLGANREAELAQACIRHWLLPSAGANLDAIRVRLSERLSRIAILTRRLCSTDRPSASDFPDDDYLHLDLVRALTPICETYEIMYPGARDRRWALCFDELEIAPRWFQEIMLDKLRSASQRFLLKLCTAPTPAWPKERKAYADMDFEVVPLASDGQADQDFSRELAAAVIRRETKREIAPEEFFGMSPFAERPQRGRIPSGYEEGSDAWTLFRDLSQYDAALSELLRKRDIDLADCSTMHVRKRQDVLRKAKPIALLRKEYSQRGARAYGQLEKERRQRLGRKLRPVPRNVANVYHGWDVICKAGEGNPRWLIMSLMLLLDRAGQKGLGKRPLMSARDQAVVMRSLSERFANYLLSLGELSLKQKEPAHHIWHLLELLGGYFHGQLVAPDVFPLDPPGSFTPDARVLGDVLEKLRGAEFEGAVVDFSYGPDFATSDSVSGRKFRLSYRLAPKFGLLLRKCKPVSLARLMSTHSVLKEYCVWPGQPECGSATPRGRGGRPGRPRRRDEALGQPPLPYAREDGQ